MGVGVGVGWFEIGWHGVEWRIRRGQQHARQMPTYAANIRASHWLEHAHAHGGTIAILDWDSLMMQK